MRIVGKDDVGRDEYVVLDGHELEETARVDPHAIADAVPCLKDGVRTDADVIADHVVLADGCALTCLEALADLRARVQRREGPDDAPRPYS